MKKVLILEYSLTNKKNKKLESQNHLDILKHKTGLIKIIKDQMNLKILEIITIPKLVKIKIITIYPKHIIIATTTTKETSLQHQVVEVELISIKKKIKTKWNT